MRPSTTPLLFLALLASAHAQQQQPCGPPPAILQSTAPNIFSEQQEQWLGDAMADYEDRSNRPVRNPAESAYLETIGNRLLAALPATTLKFKFTLVESPEINGFSLAGGHVYITRKLVASAHSEDEVATVIAHEMGHILTHQFAIQTTADLKRLLNITSVTDRADIYTKYQRLVDAQLHDKHPIDNDSDANQDQADRVAVYAAAHAGYRPQAYAEFWDRSFFVGGKTGSGFTDFFHTTTPSQKRLRKIKGIIAELPAGCAVAESNTQVANVPFQTWQHLVLEDQAIAPTATAAALDVQLSPPLRLDIEHIRFSRDGKYLLAQDESSVFVLSRDPFKVLFRFDAPDAYHAGFTPDSQNVAFLTSGLHVESWNIAQQKLQSAHEVNIQEECIQSVLSPDARTLICVSYPPEDINLKLRLIDIGTGSVLFEKKGWFQPNFNIGMVSLVHLLERDPGGLFTYSFSADGNFLLIGPGYTRLAFDLRSRTQIKIGGMLTDASYTSAYCFSGNNKVYAVNHYDPAKSGVFSFPDGQRLEQVKISLPWMTSTTGGEYVATEGPKEANSALADIRTGKYVFAARTSTVDIFDKSVAHENLDGSLSLTGLGENDTIPHPIATLPISPLARARSVTLSPGGRYLALSERTRGIVWDLQSGKQLFLVRGFNDASWLSADQLLGRFPAFDKVPETIGELTMSPKGAKDLSFKLPEDSELESGHLVAWKADNKHNWDLTAYSPTDAKVQWTRHFADNHQPAYTTNDGDNDFLFSYTLDLSLAKEKLRNDPNLKAQAAAVKQKGTGRLIEIVNSADGVTRSQVVVEVPLTYRGVGGFNHVGDLLYLSLGDNRTIVYNASTGVQLRQFFGYVVAADPATGVVCTSNRRDEVVVLDKTGAELLHQTMASPLRFADLRDQSTKLLVLTADQRFHRIPIPTKQP